jgi:hypothetical protein
MLEIPSYTRSIYLLFTLLVVRTVIKFDIVKKNLDS